MHRVRHLLLIAALTTSGVTTVASAQVRLLGIDGTNLIELNPANGAVLNSIPLTGGPAGGVGGLTWDAASGTVFLSSTTQDNLWTVDVNTGALTLVGPYNAGAPAMSGLEVDDAGQLFAYSGFVVPAGRFYSVNRTTGQATAIADPGIGGFGSLAFVASTGTMYLADTVLDRLLTIDRATGATAVVGPYGPLSGANGQIGIAMAYHPQFGLYATNNTSTDGLFTIDLVTGAATLVSMLTTNNLISLAFVGAGSPGTSYCFGDGTAAACPCGNSSPVGANAGCLHSLGTGGKLVASGTASLANDSVTLLGSDMPNSSALYFQGTTQQAGGLGVAFGDGLRCAGGSIIRLATATNAGGASQYPFGALPPVHVKGAIAAPGTRTYQVWYRNAAVFCTVSTFNLTNGREISWAP